MGCQGDIYTVYGVQADAEVLYQRKPNENPVIYGINGHGFCEDPDAIGVLDQLAYEVETCGVSKYGYGATDLTRDLELTVRFLGHNRAYGMNMGSRHFDGKALLGFVVCNECYADRASALPPLGQIMKLGPRVIKAIKKKTGLEVKESDLGLHLLFDYINGM